MQVPDSLYQNPLPVDSMLRDTTQRGTLAWRITQSMKGCSPQLIDSVIQAHIPQRELVRSTRPDTLSIPGIPLSKTRGSISANIEQFDEVGFFARSPYLHTEISYRQRGMSGVSLPYMLWRDNWVTGALIVSMIILIYIINRTRHQIVQQAKDFFFKTVERPTLFAEETSFETNAVFFMIFLLSLLGGLMSFVYAQYTLNLFLSQVSPYQLLFLYMGCFLGYFALKRITGSFVNWVFFEKSQQKSWRESENFLISVECLLFFPLALIFVYFNISVLQTLTIFAFLLFICKTLLLFKCYSIFFKKIFCLLHLFAYLSALEFMPMLALWKTLIYITDNLITKY